MKLELVRKLSSHLALLMAAISILGYFAAPLAGQTPAGVQAKAAEPPSSPAAVRKEALGPAADSIQPYKSAGRDPFRKIVLPKGAAAARAPRQVGFPALDARRAQFRQKLAQAHSAGGPEPDPLTQYLVSELTVIGTFSDDQGPGVFLKALPSGTTFYVRRGAHCYNGEVTRIETNPADLSSARVVFKEVTYSEQEGKQTPTDKLVTKSVGSH